MYECVYEGKLLLSQNVLDHSYLHLLICAVVHTVSTADSAGTACASLIAACMDLRILQ